MQDLIMNKVNFAFSLSLLIFSSTVFSETTKSFEGWYIGGNIGYGTGTNHDIYVVPGNAEASGTPRDLDGTIGGIQAGYNWQLDNNIVLGFEAGFSAANISGGISNAESISEYYDEVEINQAFNLNFKAGYAIENWLLYTTAGLTVASMDYSRGCYSDPTTTIKDCLDPYDATADDTRVGYNIGAGVEWQITDSFSSALEYRYTDLGESDAWLASDANTLNDSYARYKTDYQEITLRFNYRF
jgi:outer membrane immunogenic protein